MDNGARCGISGGMTRKTDILILGGGLNGPLLALALARAGLSVALVDARPAPARSLRDFDGRAYALALASVRMLGALGLWAGLAPLAQPMLAIRTAQGVVGQGAFAPGMGFDAAELDESAMGGGAMGQMLEDRHLYAALLAAVQAEGGITLHHDARAVAQDVGPDGVTVTLADGRTLSARLLVGADGRDSGVAARAGIRRQGWDYGQTALVCALAVSRPHGGTAHQVFLPGGPLAILPLPGDRVSIVWSEGRALAEQVAALDDAGYLAALAPRLGDLCGAARLEGARFAYPLRLSLAETWVAPRLALVGDAAHGVHPIAGQGLNLGLRDVAALAQVLIEAHRRGEDIAALDVLERYQTWRQPDTVRLALGMDAVNRLFSNDNPILRAARGLGMAVVDGWPALRRGFIRQAAGLTTDAPRLLQGLSI
jgi:2-octaprenyl-6-methoxyphenol hydroxylase